MTEQTPQTDELNPESLLEKAKTVGALVKEKKYFRAVKEIFVLLIAVYKKYIKGKSNSLHLYARMYFLC